MQKHVLRIGLLICMLLLGGCSKDFNKKEINEIDMIRVLGIDFEDDMYTVTALYGVGGGDTINGEINTIDGEGESLFEAFENLKKSNKKNITLAYTGFFLLGEGLVDSSVEDTIYYLVKDETVKMNALLFVTKDVKAKDVIKDAKENETMIQDDLTAMVQKRLESVTRNENTILWLYEDLADAQSSMIIPYLNYEEKELTLGGYTALLDGRKEAYLDEATSLGADLLLGIVRSCPLILDDGYGIMTNNIQTSIVPTLQTNMIVMHVTIKFDSVIRSVPNGNNTLDNLTRKRIKAQLENAILDIVNNATTVAKSLNVDIFGVDDRLQKDYSIWSTLDGHYSDYMQYTEYNYTIQSRVTRSSVLEGWR